VQAARENLRTDVAAAILAAFNSHNLTSMQAVVLCRLVEGGELLGGDFDASRRRLAVAHGD